MQVQKVCANPSKKKPSFGMKIYINQTEVRTVRNALDTLVIQGDGELYKINSLQNLVKENIKNLIKNIAEHNAEPKNHQLFDNSTEIKRIKVKYNYDVIADSSGAKTHDVKGLQKKIADYEDKHGVDVWQNNNVTIELATDNSETIMDHLQKTMRDPINWAAKIQEKEIQKMEYKNPDLYLDMIQPPKK